MRSFEHDYLHVHPVGHETIRMLAGLDERRGRGQVTHRISPHVMDRLREHAVIQSVESSNRLEGVEAEPGRLRGLVAGKIEPRDRSEAEITGYWVALDRIHTDHAGIRPTPEAVQTLHAGIYSFTSGRGGMWKRADNEIAETGPGGRSVVRFRPIPAIQTPACMDSLHALLDRELQADIVHPLLVTAAYVLDLLCIHPFLDGNGRVARLMSLLLLYRAGYDVGRYVSLERLIEESRTSYYEVLLKSSVHWHEGKHTLRPWTEYFLGVLLKAYGELEELVGELEVVRGAKGRLVEEAIARLPASFRTRDIERLCPTVSRDMVRVVLNRLKAAGAIRSEGSGAGAFWRKLGDTA
jgi:hypothetical protein